MSTKEIELGRLFGEVSTALAQNRESINSSDGFNTNHGDNMVENFRLITRAVNRKKGAAPAEQLAYASQVLSKNAQTGSARMYSQGLARAAEQMRGKPAVTEDNVMVLLQALLGSQTPAQENAPVASDPLGGLFGSILGGEQAASHPASAPASQPGDLLGGLFNTLMGQQPSSSQPDQAAPAQPGGGGIDLKTVLTAGLAFLQAREQGATPVQALVNALMAGSQMNATPHHSQSGQLVATTLINAVSSMLGK